MSNHPVEKKSIKKFVKQYKVVKKRPVEEEFTLYKSNQFAKISNKFTEPITALLLNKFPDLFKPLQKSLKLVRFNMLSKSYIGLVLFLSAISFVIFTVLFSVILKNV